MFSQKYKRSETFTTCVECKTNTVIIISKLQL